MEICLHHVERRQNQGWLSKLKTNLIFVATKIPGVNCFRLTNIAKRNISHHQRHQIYFSTGMCWLDPSGTIKIRVCRVSLSISSPPNHQIQVKSFYTALKFGSRGTLAPSACVHISGRQMIYGRIWPFPRCHGALCKLFSLITKQLV